MSNQLLIFIIALAQNITIIIYVNAVFDYKYNRKLTNIFLFIFLMLLFLVTTPIINIKPLKLFFIKINIVFNMNIILILCKVTIKL